MSKVCVLVTGGAGYIGSHTVWELLEADWVSKVVVIDDLSTGFREALPDGVVFYPVRLQERSILTRVMRLEQVSAVIHFAAKIIVPESVEKPLIYYENNVGGTLSLLNACEEAGVRRLIFSSTAAVYGETDGNSQIKENFPINPSNPYGASKVMSERMIQDSYQGFGLQSVILRYFNVAGARADLKNGQRTKQATHLIKVAAEAACGKRPWVDVFGSDYPTADGTGVRDYIHVVDLARIHVKALEWLQENPSCGSEIFNCGYGKGYSVLEVLNVMKKLSDNDFPVRITGRRPGDVAQLVANPEKLLSTLNWTPQFNQLEEICRTAYLWEKKISLA